MIDGTLIFQGTTVFSPWFPRGGDFVTVTAELIAKSGGTLKIELFHKNANDPGDGANVDTAGTPKSITFNNPTPPVRTSTDWAKSATIAGLKELVRYKFTMTGSGSEWMLFRMLPPVWYDKVETS
jgi:hypothetical protein